MSEKSGFKNEKMESDLEHFANLLGLEKATTTSSESLNFYYEEEDFSNEAVPIDCSFYSSECALKRALYGKALSVGGYVTKFITGNNRMYGTA